MLWNYPFLQTVLSALTLSGFTTPSSEHLHHIHTRQDPAGPANMLPEVLGRYEHLSTYFRILKKYPEILAGAKAGAVTLLAPINSAFEKVTYFDVNDEAQIVPVLRYHVLQKIILTADLQVVDPHFVQTMLFNQSWTNVTGGQRVTLMRQDEEEVFFVSGLDSRSMIDYQNRDIYFFEGFMQPVDTLLVPPLPLAETIRARVPSMSAFLGALYKTGLADEVMQAKDVTIFAPDNQAFQRTFDALDELTLDELRNVLAYHIVPDRILYSNRLQHQGQFPTSATLDNDEGVPINITISSAGNHRYIDSSAVQDPDIMIANGVVHMHASPIPSLPFLLGRPTADQTLSPVSITGVLNPLKPNAKAEPVRKVQSPVFDLRGNATTGRTVPTPFLSDLPCLVDCPATETLTLSHKPQQYTPNMRAAAAKCTGMSGLKAAVGIGMLAGFL